VQERTRTLASPHEPLLLEFGDRFANRSSANAEHPGQIGLIGQFPLFRELPTLQGAP
jgi:hypothetical protein